MFKMRSMSAQLLFQALRDRDQICKLRRDGPVALAMIQNERENEWQQDWAARIGFEECFPRRKHPAKELQQRLWIDPAFVLEEEIKQDRFACVPFGGEENVRIVGAKFFIH